MAPVKPQKFGVGVAARARDGRRTPLSDDESHRPYAGVDMDVVVLADTHLRVRAEQRLPRAVLDAVTAADLVLHAGDVISADALASFEQLAPFCAVLGNNDHELVTLLPDTVELELEGVRIAMLHDSGTRAGRQGRLQRRFPTPTWSCSATATSRVTKWASRPGPLQPRIAHTASGQPFPTMGALRLADGSVVRRRIIALGQD